MLGQLPISTSLRCRIATIVVICGVVCAESQASSPTIDGHYDASDGYSNPDQTLLGVRTRSDGVNQKAIETPIERLRQLRAGVQLTDPTAGDRPAPVSGGARLLQDINGGLIFRDVTGTFESPVPDNIFGLAGSNQLRQQLLNRLIKLADLHVSPRRASQDFGNRVYSPGPTLLSQTNAAPEPASIGLALIGFAAMSGLGLSRRKIRPFDLRS